MSAEPVQPEPEPEQQQQQQQQQQQHPGPQPDDADLSHVDSVGLLGQATVARLEALGVRGDVDEAWARFRARLEAQGAANEQARVQLYNRSIELECDLDISRKRLEDKEDELRQVEAKLAEVKRQNDFAENNKKAAQQAKDALQSENASLKRERDTLSSERNDLLSLAERRQTEIDRLTRENSSLSSQLEAASREKCEALMKAEEVASRELTLNYKEQRFNEEREYLSQQASQLMDELSRRNEDVLEAKREQLTKLATTQSQLEATSEQLRVSEAREAGLREDNAQLVQREQELITRLKEARESELKLEDNYKQELSAQTKLAELYKGQSSDAESKTAELTKAVTELQRLLSESVERYGTLEHTYNTQKVEHKEELQKHGDALRALKEELSHANELIQTLQNKGLSAEGIEQLAPSAAAAAKLIRSGTSLTGVYSSLVTCQEELLTAKEENRRLNAYIEQILHEIEERAPVLKQQREDYERAVAAVSGLSRQLEEARQEYEFRRRDAEDARQRHATISRENARFRTQVHDMGQQLAVLVREIETLRAEKGAPVTMAVDAERSLDDAESIINEKLLTFRDLSELQKRNIELLSVVRELSKQRESSDSSLVAEKTAELQAELAGMASEVQALKEARSRQENLVESIILERDMYKSVALRVQDDNQQGISTPMASSIKPGTTPSPLRKQSNELETRAVKAEAALAEVQKDFSTYRTEKCENERLLSEELSQARNELTEARTKAVRLAAQEEHNAERFKIAQANAESYRKQVGLLETKNGKLNAIVAKHEEQLGLLRTELLSAQSKLSQAEVQLDFLRHEKTILQASEARLTASNELLHQQKKSSSLVLENLNQIKLKLEQDESERGMALSNRNAALERELELLRKKLDAQADDYKATVHAWETRQAELTDKLEASRSTEQQLSEKLAGLSAANSTLQAKLSEAAEKLDAVGPGPAGISRQDSNTDTVTSAKVRDLQSQLVQLKGEVAAYQEQLAQAKQTVAQYKDISESAEKRLAESNSASRALKDDLEHRLRVAVDAERASAEKLAATEMQRKPSEDDQESLRAKHTQLMAEVATLSQKLSAAESGLGAVRAEAEQQAAAAREAQARYERELVEHAQDVESVKTLRAAHAERQAEVEQLREACSAAEKLAEIQKQGLESSQHQFDDERRRLIEQLGVLEKENESVHVQLATVSQQMASLQRHFDGKPSGADLSFNEEDCKSTEQLMDVIKFKRREKEILNGKLEVSEAEAARLRSQLDHAHSQLKEANAALSLARQGEASTAMSSSKYAELVQKVQTCAALSESNAMLRQEKIALSDQLDELRGKLTAAEATAGPLRTQLQAITENLDTANAEMIALKADNSRWRARANQLVEKQTKINPDELKRLQTENSALTKQTTQLQSQLKTTKTANEAGTARIKILTEQLAAAQAEAKKLKGVNANIGQKLKSLGEQLELLKAKDDELQKLRADHEQVAKKAALADKLRSLGRNYREKSEKLEANLKKAEDELIRMKETASAASSLEGAASVSTEETATLRSDLEEANELISQSAEKISELEERVSQLTAQLAQAQPAESDVVQALRDENAQCKAQLTALEDKSKRSINSLRGAKDKLQKLEEDNARLKALAAPSDKLRQANDALKKEVQELQNRLQQQQHQSTTTTSTPATATIRPVAAAARQSTVVHPVSPNLNPMASEFVPARLAAASAQQVESTDVLGTTAEQTPRARVLPRHQQDPDSEAVAGPSSRGTPVASVIPKRPRPTDDSSSQQQPGQQVPKKPRTTTTVAPTTATATAAVFSTATSSSNEADQLMPAMESSASSQQQQQQTQPQQNEEQFDLEEADADEEGVVGPDDDTEPENDEAVAEEEEPPAAAPAAPVAAEEEGQNEEAGQDLVEGVIMEEDDDAVDDDEMLGLGGSAAPPTEEREGEDSSSQFQLPGQSDEGGAVVPEVESGGNEAIAGPSRMIVHPQTSAQRSRDDGSSASAGLSGGQGTSGDQDQEDDSVVAKLSAAASSEAASTSSSQPAASASASGNLAFTGLLPDVSVSSSSVAPVDFGQGLFQQQQQHQQQQSLQQQQPVTSQASGAVGGSHFSTPSQSEDNSGAGQSQSSSEAQATATGGQQSNSGQEPLDQQSSSKPTTASSDSQGGSSQAAAAASGPSGEVVTSSEAMASSRGRGSGRGRLRRTPIVWDQNPGGAGGSRRGSSLAPVRGQKASRRARGIPRGGGGGSGGGAGAV